MDHEWTNVWTLLWHRTSRIQKVIVFLGTVACSDSAWKIFAGYEVTGGTVKSTSSSLANCRSICSGLSGCQAFTLVGSTCSTFVGSFPARPTTKNNNNAYHGRLCSLSDEATGGFAEATTVATGSNSKCI